MIASNDEAKRVHDGKRKKMKKRAWKRGGGRGVEERRRKIQYVIHDRQKDTKWNDVQLEHRKVVERYRTRNTEGWRGIRIQKDTQYRRYEEREETTKIGYWLHPGAGMQSETGKG